MIDAFSVPEILSPTLQEFCDGLNQTEAILNFQE
jgi:hypothetical protein